MNTESPSSKLQRTALVIGATGLVGRQIVAQLLEDQSYREVLVFTRRSTAVTHPKLTEHIVDFDDLDAWSEKLEGDVLFSALGTTLKTAGSKAAQHRIDYGYQYGVAEAAAKNGVPSYVLISSYGASPQSPVFYSRMKGELERDVSLLPFLAVRLLRPGLLDGERTEHRPGERLALSFLNKLPSWTSLARVRPIRAEVVARAALASGDDWTPGVHIVGPEQLFVLGT